MRSVFWVIPGKLGGRPGPDVDPWDFVTLAAEGITAIASTTEACHAQSIAKSGLKHFKHYMPEAYPTNDELVNHFVERVREAVTEVVREIESGGCVVVHCYAGRDRTGLVLCAALMELEKLDPKAALERLRAVRPTALTGPGVLDVLKAYALLYQKA